MPLDKGLPEEEIVNSLIKCKADAIVYDESLGWDFEKIIANEGITVKTLIPMSEISQEALAEHAKLVDQYRPEFKVIDKHATDIIVFTSGTSADAKAAQLSQRNIASTIAAMRKVEPIFEDDVEMILLPLHHVFGNQGVLMFISNGCTNVFCSGLKYIQKELKEYGVTAFFCVPLIIESMINKVLKTAEKEGKLQKLETGRKISKALLKVGIDVRRKLFKDIIAQMGGQLKYIISGGAPLSPAVSKGFTDLGIEIYQGYGLTETSPVLAAENKGHIRAGSIGRPLPAVEVDFKDKDEDGMGELCAKAPNVMIGYYNNNELTNEVIVDGWFHTGDLGYMDKDGYIFLTGRKKDMIVLKNGKKAFPEEIEILLNKIPGVLDSFVFGEPIDGDWTDLRIAVQVQYSAKEIQEIYGADTPDGIRNALWDKIKEVNQTIPHYKRVTDLYLTEEPFIKTTSLKIKRKEQLKRVLG